MGVLSDKKTTTWLRATFEMAMKPAKSNSRTGKTPRKVTDPKRTVIFESCPQALSGFSNLVKQSFE